jgi:hypothetical protein
MDDKNSIKRGTDLEKERYVAGIDFRPLENLTLPGIVARCQFLCEGNQLFVESLLDSEQSSLMDTFNFPPVKPRRGFGEQHDHLV